MKNLQISKKEINKISFITNMFFATAVSFLLILNFNIGQVDAQASMNGGGYTLNGGVTVFTGDSSGGGYTLGPSSDSAAPNSSGGTYILYPTPYKGESTAVTPTPTPTPTPTGPGGGFTQYPTSTASTTPGIDPIPSTTTPVNPVQPGQDQDGGPDMEWIDPGSGIDIDLDGNPDFGGTTTVPNPTDLDGNSLIKKYKNNFTPLQSTLMLFFLIGFFFARVIRSNEKLEKNYLVSRIPAAIYIDWLLTIHKGSALHTVTLPDHKLMERLSAKNHYTLALTDCVLMPALAIMLMVGIWPISYILSLVIGFLAIIRFYIGSKIDKNLS